MRETRKHLIFGYLLLGMFIIALVVVTLGWLSHQPSKKITSTAVLLQDSFEQEKPGQEIVKDSVWERQSLLSTNNQAKIRSHWFYMLNKVYHEPYIPADYAPDSKLFLGTAIVAGRLDWSDYVFQARAEPLDEEGFGLLFRFRDINNFYSLIVVKDAKNEGPYVRVIRKLGEASETIAEASQKKIFHGNYTSGKWYQLRIVAKGSNFQVKVDDEEILVFNDDSLGQGKIGLWAWEQSGVFFDDVLVQKI